MYFLQYRFLQLSFCKIRKSYFIMCIFCLFSNHIFSQDKVELKLNIFAEKEYKAYEKESYETSFSDTLQAQEEIKQTLNKFWSKGFVNVEVTGIKQIKNQVSATIKLGKCFNKFYINRITYADKLGLENSIKLKQHAFTADELAKFKEKVINIYEQQAYPFVSVNLDSISYSKNIIYSNFNITANKKVKIDSVIINGNAKLNKYYLHKYVGIKPNDDYDERIVKSINNRLKELPFVTETKPYSIIFTKKYTKLLIQLDKRKANKFDGFLGFLPNEKNDRINFTGQLNIKLLNTIAHGETIELEWRKLQALTQDLKTNFIYPYIFNLPFGVEHNLKLYKRDTTFIDVSNALGVQYLLKGGNYLKFFVSKRNINLINTSGYEFATILPEFADISNTSYGININLNNTDYKLSPRSGLKVVLQATAGTKQIRKNQIFSESVYNGLQLTSQQYQMQGAASYFIPIFKKSTILIDAKFASIIGKNIFTNELYRIGGLVSLRGFDEESINASAYIIPTIEYRFLFDKNSAIFIFANGAYYENISRTQRVFDRPYGVGTGLFFETKAGIFSLTYALGKQFNNPVLIKNAKIHFGLVSVF